MALDLEALTMTEIIQLQSQLQSVLKRRFEKNLVLVFSDVVNSTAYFARFGDAAGRGLQQLHFDLLNRVLPLAQGRIVDTAGDGAFSVFPRAEPALEAIVQLQHAISEINLQRDRDHQLTLRIGIHWGPALTDGHQVSGDAVNLAARIASSSKPGETRLSKPAWHEVSVQLRMRCKPTPPLELKGIGQPVETFLFEWRDPSVFPGVIRVQETGEVWVLPDRDTLGFGRLKEIEDEATKSKTVVNDFVLTHPNPDTALRLSRWHFELRRYPTSMVLRQVSDQMTEIDGHIVKKGQEVVVRPGTVVRVARVLTLQFAAAPSERESDPTKQGTIGFSM